MKSCLTSLYNFFVVWVRDTVLRNAHSFGDQQAEPKPGFFLTTAGGGGEVI